MSPINNANRDGEARSVEGAFVAAATLFLALSAKLLVPFYAMKALQNFIVIGLGFTLDAWRAVAAILLYLLQGAAGLCVFAGMAPKHIGLSYTKGPTNDSLFGYKSAALLAGRAARLDWPAMPVLVSIVGLLAGGVPGLLWLGLVTRLDEPLLQYGVHPFILGDLTLASLLLVAGRVALGGKVGR
ncbi:biotin transporter BioY [Mesorhizobium sp.]|nr:biotin transporter BioY [Mesorhizobium sp.]RWH02914.1 MAG: biotin transporter BioY [Mesorhizobium sp.]TIS04484.1 MAG: biotin transporter BioY [Mesorhizobium sp.]